MSQLLYCPDLHCYTFDTGSPVVMLHLWFHAHLMVAIRQAPPHLHPPPTGRKIKNCWENNEANLLFRLCDLWKNNHIQKKTRKSIFYVLKWHNILGFNLCNSDVQHGYGFIYDKKNLLWSKRDILHGRWTV